eukprot:614596-Rhodomonas_salina.2
MEAQRVSIPSEGREGRESRVGEQQESGVYEALSSGVQEGFRMLVKGQVLDSDWGSTSRVVLQRT